MKHAKAHGWTPNDFPVAKSPELTGADTGRAALRGASLLLLLGGLACSIADKKSTVDAGSPSRPQDSGVDAGLQTDGGIDCTQTGCESGFFCHASGECRARGGSCDGNEDCASDEACGRTGTSTISGTCGALPRACTTEANCENHESCHPLGFCLAKASKLKLGNTLEFVSAPLFDCQASTDCGPSLNCVNQTCQTCETSLECGNLRCENGRCVEPGLCTSDTECFSGHRCLSGTCQPDTSQCTADPENDTAILASSVYSGAYYNQDICGDEQDWYQIVLNSPEGLLAILLWDREEADLALSLADQTGNARNPDNAVSGPGFSVVELNALTTSSTLTLGVSSLNRSAAYTLFLQTPDYYCAKDPADWGNDSNESQPVFISRGDSAQFKVCQDDIDARSFSLSSGESLQVDILTENQGTELELVELGTTLGSTTATISADGKLLLSLNVPPVAAPQNLSFALRSGAAPVWGQAYSLQLHPQHPNRNTQCNAAPQITTSLSQSIQPNNQVDLGRPNCSEFLNTDSGDHLFRLTAPDPTRPTLVRVQVASDPYLATRPAIALLSDCENNTPIACAESGMAGRSTELTEVLPAAQDGVLWISDNSLLGSTATVSVSLQALPTVNNDACSAPETLPVQAELQIGISTYGASNAHDPASIACGEIQSGPDRVYELNLAAGERAVVELEGPIGTLLWSASACSLSDLQCRAIAEVTAHTPRPSLLLGPADPRSSLLIVDENKTSPGTDAQLRILRNPACLTDSECVSGVCEDYQCVPYDGSADSCPGQLLSFGGNQTVVSGNLTHATDAHLISCGTTARADQVYRIEVPDGLSALQASIRSAAFNPVIALRYQQCLFDGYEQCNDDIAQSLLPELRWDHPKGGSYFLFVESTSATTGPFELSVTLVP